MADDLAELRRLVGRGTTPNALALLPKHVKLVRRLIASHGSLAAARVAAGVRDPNTRTSRPKALAKRLRELANRGVDLTAARLRELGEERLLADARRTFGSMRAAREAADALLVKEPRWRRLSSEETIAAIRAQADETGTVRRSDLHADTVRAARRHFGGVVSAIKAAGMAHPHRRRSSRVRVPRTGIRSAEDLALDRDVVRQVLDVVARSSDLSVRERHVLAALVYGVPRSRVPEALGISESSVKTYVRKLLRKLNLASADEAVWWIRTQVGARSDVRSAARMRRE